MPPTPPEIQKMAYTAAGPVGQSGYSYSIERVLQEKGIPPRRVYLARSVLLKLNYQTIHLLTPADPAPETTNLY